MAKKIRLDFSKTEERSGLNTRHIPEGLHSMKIAGVKVTEANDGTAMLVYELVPTESKYKTRRFPFYCKLQQNQLFKVRDLLVAAGISVPKKALNIDPEAPVGKTIAAEVEDESNPQYAGRSTVQAVYGVDIIDGEDSPEDDEESEDEEYEEEYDDADDQDEDDDEEEDDEEEEADDDELREELDALTLPALRKRAKELGIDTAGVKRPDLTELIIEEELAEDEDADDEEDDDLDDEELADEEDDEEYEDDEDEEEEEAPAPKRSAKKAPAKKAPAKAAPKASATRRTVKRR